MHDTKRSIAIVGTGLIGGSVGLASLGRGLAAEVIGFDVEPDRLEDAVRRGAVTRAASKLEEAASGCDLVVIATPVSSIAEVFGTLAPHLDRGTIVTDVGSTKARVVAETLRLAPPEVHFIGGHPLAGSEQEGVGAARGDLFGGCVWFLTPTAETEPGAYRGLVRFISGLGASVLSLDPERHDELVATTSHLPQVLASALMRFASEMAVSGTGLPLIAAAGFRDMTRLAGSSSDLWIDILRENRRAVAEVLGRFGADLAQIRVALDSEDWETLRETLSTARRARAEMPSVKPGLARSVLVELAVPVPDRPGVLAEITTTLGEAGVNIEDIDIAHAPGGGRGTIYLVVEGEEAARSAEQAIRGRGYTVSRAR